MRERQGKTSEIQNVISVTPARLIGMAGKVGLGRYCAGPLLHDLRTYHL